MNYPKAMTRAMKTEARRNEIVGGILRPNAAIQEDYSAAILTLVRRMCDEARDVCKELLDGWSADAAMDDNISVSARVRFNALMEKYEPLFNKVAKKATKRMVDRTLKNSSVTLGMSLREMSENLKLNTDVMTDRLSEVVAAQTTEAVNLIRAIPAKYLPQVQTQVMRSITTGQGLHELVPFLAKKYGENVRHARNVAMDQTRKAYNGINAERMQAIGVKSFKWLHISGSKEPRPLHIELSGKVFEFADPPYIGEMYGSAVHGLPGMMPNCRCVLRPILTFNDD